MSLFESVMDEAIAEAIAEAAALRWMAKFRVGVNVYRELQYDGDSRTLRSAREEYRGIPVYLDEALGVDDVRLERA